MNLRHLAKIAQMHLILKQLLHFVHLKKHRVENYTCGSLSANLSNDKLQQLFIFLSVQYLSRQNSYHNIKQVHQLGSIMYQILYVCNINVAWQLNISWFVKEQLGRLIIIPPRNVTILLVRRVGQQSHNTTIAADTKQLFQIKHFQHLV